MFLYDKTTEVYNRKWYEFPGYNPKVIVLWQSDQKSDGNGISKFYI